MEPPRLDMLHILFRGDTLVTTLPYCEVANGDLTEVDKQSQKATITTILGEAAGKQTVVSFKDFIELIEQGFSAKDILKLQVQQKGAYEAIKIL